MIAFALPPITLEIARRRPRRRNHRRRRQRRQQRVLDGHRASPARSRRAAARRSKPRRWRRARSSRAQCVITSGGRLPARYVIHAAVMGQDLRTSAALIDRATRNALELAAARQLASVAFPAFGTGVGGFPLAECARIDARGDPGARERRDVVAPRAARAVRSARRIARSRRSPASCSARRSTARRIVRYRRSDLREMRFRRPSVCLRCFMALRAFDGVVISDAARTTPQRAA